MEITAKVKDLTGEVEDLEQGVVETRDWVAQIPEGAVQARVLAQKAVDKKLGKIDQARQKKAWELKWSVNKISAM